MTHWRVKAYHPGTRRLHTVRYFHPDDFAAADALYRGLYARGFVVTIDR